MTQPHVLPTRPLPRVGSARAGQRGVTMIGLMLWAIVIGFVGYLVVRTLPTLNEFATIKRTVEKIAAAPPSTVPEIRAAFDRQKSIEYSIQSISGKDLKITKENDRVVIAFEYDQEIPIMDPVYLLIKYSARTK